MGGHKAIMRPESEKDILIFMQILLNNQEIGFLNIRDNLKKSNNLELVTNDLGA